MLPKRDNVRDFNHEIDEEMSYARPLALTPDWWRRYNMELDHRLRRGEMIPTIVASFAPGDAQPSDDCKIPERCLRAASILRITDTDNPISKWKGGDIYCSMANRWNWRKGWARDQWAKKALDTFLEGYGPGGEEGGTPKIIQIHTVLDPKPGDHIWYELQLTFLFFLFEGRSMHAIPRIEIVRRDGSPVPPSKGGPLDWTMRDIQGLCGHLQEHGESIGGKIFLWWHEKSSVTASILAPGVEKHIYTDEGKDIEEDPVELAKQGKLTGKNKNVDDRNYCVHFVPKAERSLAVLSLHHMTQPVKTRKEWAMSLDGMIIVTDCPYCLKDTTKHESIRKAWSGAVLKHRRD